MATEKPQGSVDRAGALDPVVEAYKKDIDRTLIRENLKLTPEERLLKLQSFVEFHQQLRHAPRRPS